MGIGGAGEVRSAVEWAEVRALAADGVSQRQIAARLGLHRKTVKRLLEAPDALYPGLVLTSSD
jgi:transposase